jgi:hypothetical protein
VDWKRHEERVFFSRPTGGRYSTVAYRARTKGVAFSFVPRYKCRLAYLRVGSLTMLDFCLFLDTYTHRGFVKENCSTTIIWFRLAPTIVRCSCDIQYVSLVDSKRGELCFTVLGLCEILPSATDVCSYNRIKVSY